MFYMYCITIYIYCGVFSPFHLSYCHMRMYIFYSLCRHTCSFKALVHRSFFHSLAPSALCVASVMLPFYQNLWLYKAFTFFFLALLYRHTCCFEFHPQVLYFRALCADL